jgi:hypothetical protein
MRGPEGFPTESQLHALGKFESAAAKGVANGAQSGSTRLPGPFLMDTLSIHFDRQ